MQMLISGAVQGEDGHQGVLAVLLIVDMETGEIVHRAEYMPPDELRSEGQKIQFTGSCFHENEYYVCSHNEVLVYSDWPPVEPSRRITHKGFNDLHHVYPWKGGLAVSNTGLETVDHVTFDGELIERWDLLRDETECRVLDESRDMRLIPDTKPHLRHGNHLFELDGKLWTSQLKTEDAVCVEDLSRRLEMGSGQPHDGVFLHGKLVFTTTNGYLVIFEPENGMRRTIHNLTEMTEGVNQLGWCRGVTVEPGNPDRYWVCFSALRRSKWKDFGYWIKYGHHMPRSHIALYDLAERRRVVSKTIGEGVGYQLFQIDVLPPEREV